MFIRNVLTRRHHDAELAEGFSESELDQLLEQLLAEGEESSYRNLKRMAWLMVSSERRTRSSFERRLRRRWRRGIDLYDLFLIYARQAGEEFNREHREQAINAQDWVFESLVRIHARACLIASEVRALMLAGHASGANARWRSLHELVVVAWFIAAHGNETAERYMLHEAIRSAKEAEAYHRHHKALGHAPLERGELDRIRRIRTDLLSRFGQEFDGAWGWAASELRGTPTFARIEEAVGLDHWRPHFGMASHSIHAGYKGMTFDIGLMGRARYDTLMLAGPSNAGLADPGHGAALSLMNCTVALLNHKSSEKSVTTSRILMRLTDEIGQAFLEAHQKLERDEAKYNKPPTSTPDRNRSRGGSASESSNAEV